MSARLATLQGAVEALPPPVREELARRWSRAALEEHASIASFGRFALQLMAIGAPPEFIEGAHRAALDELKHTQLCLELAEVYTGEPLAPGPLDLSGDLLGDLELSHLAAATAIEGCVGETVAALVARTAAERSVYRPVKAALNLIAKDEERHAALAWRFVSWALRQDDPEVAPAVRRAFAAALPVPFPPDPEGQDHDTLLAAHGKLGALALHLAEREAVEQVLRPTVRALLP